MQAVLGMLAVALAVLAGPLRAEPRIALVIGNSEYSSVSSLENPVRDARLIAATLESLGFEVTSLIDAGQTEMKRGIGQFGRKLREAGDDATGLFYYAGHGVQSFGANYLLPVDVALSDAADLDLVAIEAQSVLRQMYSARNRTNIVILDACRNNPFTSIPEFNDNGLAEMQAPTGSFLAYATAPGDVALDGTNGNSPFTRALAGLMKTPGLPIEQMFKQVRVEVLAETRGAQTPWDASSLTSDFVFAPAKEMSPEEREAQQVWQSVQKSRDPLQVMLFLRGYGKSAYAGEARALLSELMEAELSSDAPQRPAAAAEGPSDDEKRMFDAAQADGSKAAYQAFLDSYPNGTYAEIATQELAALSGGGGTDPAGGGIAPAPAPVAAAPEPAPEPEPQGPITFTTPMQSEVAALNGKTIEQIIGASPMFPPIEGLPEAVWKGQTCSHCHEWTRDRLCTQAQTYLSLNMQRSLDKAHPFGGALKRNLKAWAAGGCP